MKFYGDDKQRAALLAAMAKMLQVRAKSSVSTDATNPHFRKKYATLAAVLEAGLPAAAEAGLAFFQTTEHRTIPVGQGDPPPQVPMLFLITGLGHSEGGVLFSEYPVEPTKKDSQGYKAAVTYAKRVGAESILGLAPDDDDDGETAVGRGAAQGTAKKPPARKPPTQPAKPVEPAPAPADESAKIRKELDFLKAQLGEEIYREAVPRDPTTLAAAKRCLTAARQAFNSLVESKTQELAPSNPTPADQVVAQARAGSAKKPWEDHDDGRKNDAVFGGLQ